MAVMAVRVAERGLCVPKPAGPWWICHPSL